MKQSVLPFTCLFVEKAKTFLKLLSIITDEKQHAGLQNITNITAHLIKPQPNGDTDISLCILTVYNINSSKNIPHSIPFLLCVGYISRISI